MHTQGLKIRAMIIWVANKVARNFLAVKTSVVKGQTLPPSSQGEPPSPWSAKCSFSEGLGAQPVHSPRGQLVCDRVLFRASLGTPVFGLFRTPRLRLLFGVCQDSLTIPIQTCVEERGVGTFCRPPAVVR